jgi:transposase
MKKRTRRVFSKEFKKEAVKMVTEGGRGISETARNLDVHPNTLSKWIRQFKEDKERAFPGKGNLLPLDEENRQLKRELKSVQEERDILKKVVAIFSKPQK